MGRSISNENKIKRREAFAYKEGLGPGNVELLKREQLSERIQILQMGWDRAQRKLEFAGGDKQVRMPSVEASSMFLSFSLL